MSGPVAEIVVAELASCWALDGYVVVDSLAVEVGGELHAADRCIEGLPFAGRLGGVDVRPLLVVERAVLGGIVVGMTEAVEDLDLVAASQVDAAVAVLRHVELDVELEVSEFTFGDDVDAAPGVVQDAVMYGPAVLMAGPAHAPSVKVLAVEEVGPFG